MRTRLATSLLAVAALAAGAWLASDPTVMGWNRAVAALLRPLALRWPWLNIVWVIAGLPVTAAVLGVALWRMSRLRRHWPVIAAMAVAGSLVELLCKHFVALPRPSEVPAPVFWNQLVGALNLGPSNLTPLLHWLHPHVRGETGSTLFPGSYPSGHVYRTTFLTGMLAPPGRRLWAAPVVVAVAFMTVATGGHWAWDTLGGALLGIAAVSLATPPGPIRVHRLEKTPGQR